ncbi:MAG TPA: efflux transporter outer membrane subunit [Candidatus Acidoferrales bacterium]|nr:efflux transporter outer membrane subunit [Candidatus Acidoferrales bacterium]
MTNMRNPAVLLLVMGFICGCAVGPNYKRPPVDTPSVYRGLTPEEAARSDARSLADEKWWEVFQDEQLKKLIGTALQQNYDLRRAATRVLEAQAVLGITRADQFPTVTGQASATIQRTSQQKILPAIETNANRVGLALDWELDFWGRFRRATEAARANLVATEWARREIITELIANLTNAYFRLRALDLQLEISRRTLASRQDSLRLTLLLAEGGSTSMLDVRQAEQLVFTAASEVPSLEQQIEQQENFISILLGNNPAPVPRGRELTEQRKPPAVPPGLPSSLLERRPDIRQAEQQLIAANAQIGVARAAYFPQIALTGTSGYQSSALTSLFTGPAGFWSFGTTLAQPIFTAGRLRSNVRLTEAQQQEALFSYQQIIQSAFRDVSDALIASRKTQEFREQQQLLVDSAKDATRLSQMRYKGGAASYLEVLTNDTNYFSAELGLVQAQLDELQAFVRLYKSLGGGWEQ